MTGGLDGVMYASSSNGGSSTLYTVDIATGAATEVGQITNAPAIIDIAMSPDMVLYGVDIVNDVLVMIDPQTDAGTVDGSLGFAANYAQGMDFEEESGVLYLAAYNGNSSSGELRVADLDTGATTLIGAFPGAAEVDAFAFATGGQAPCETDTDCDDETFCTGDETCDNGTCVSSGDPCAIDSLICDEDSQECVECLGDDNCTDGRICEYGMCVFPCELSIDHKAIEAQTLFKPRSRTISITGGEGFDPNGAIDFGPFEVRRSKVNSKKGKLKVKVIVPMWLEAGMYEILVGECSGEIEVTGTAR